MKEQEQHRTNDRMTPEQVARYAAELMFYSSDPVENFVGNIMIEPAYECKYGARVDAAIGKLKAHRGSNKAINQAIDRAIAKIEGH